MNITVRCTEKRAQESGVEFVARQYLDPTMSFMECLEDLLEVSGLTGADVVAVEVTA